ncbi:MAG: radical SAM protein [Nitrososphaerales archaeon]
MDYEAPIHVSWQCTGACNLRCIHCYADAGKPLEDELDTKEAKELIESVSNLGAKSMVFSGGEPLARQDIFELMNHTKDVGLTPIIATNGTLIDRRAARSLKDVKAAVAINMPALDGRVNDVFTKTTNSQRAKMEGLANCLKEGVPLSLGVAVTNLNIDELFKIVDFSYRIRINCDILATIPVGRASLGILPSPMMYEEKLRQILRNYSAVPMNVIDQGSGTRVSVYEPIYSKIMVEEGLKSPPRLCTIGKIMHVMENGTVRTCVHLPISSGNVRRKSLEEIWKSIHRSRLFSRLGDPDSLRGICGKCDHKHICGGCRARAYAVTGDLYSQDPICSKTLKEPR